MVFVPQDVRHRGTRSGAGSVPRWARSPESRASTPPSCLQTLTVDDVIPPSVQLCPDWFCSNSQLILLGLLPIFLSSSFCVSPDPNWFFLLGCRIISSCCRPEICRALDVVKTHFPHLQGRMWGMTREAELFLHNLTSGCPLPPVQATHTHPGAD